MPGPSYEGAISESHRIAVELEGQQAYDPEAPSTTTLEAHAKQLSTTARNAVFRRLASERNRFVIEGVAVVEGVAALMYANGRDRDESELMANHLNALLHADAEQESTRAVLAGRASHMLDVVGVAEPRLHLTADSLSPDVEHFRPYADLHISYEDDTLFHRNSNPGGSPWYTTRYTPYFRRPNGARLRIEDLAIFDKAEEAAAHAAETDFKPYVLLGQAVPDMLATQETQEGLAMARIIEAPRVDVELQPEVDALDLPAAAAACMHYLAVKSRGSSYDSAGNVPAQAHFRILAQMSQEELLSAAQTAIDGATAEAVASSPHLINVRLKPSMRSERRVPAQLQRVAEGVVAAYAENAGVGNMPTKALVQDLAGRYAQSLPESVPRNHGFGFAIGPMGRARQRRVARKVAEHAHETAASVAA